MISVEEIQGQSIDFHCHGVGHFDFTELHELNLYEIERLLSERKQKAVLTLYLPKPNFQHFFEIMDIFSNGKSTGKFDHIVGFGLEGPLLASHGGTPEKGIWQPTKQEWLQLASCGKQGLIYVIFSPDAHQVLDLPYSTSWIAETLLDNGVLPAPGHFTKLNPKTSAIALQEIFDVVETWGHGATVTDHLFNDMPNNFKHAYRTPEEKLYRHQGIQDLNLDSWNFNNIDEKMGLVPATILRNAKKGLVKICQNFDGEHVDLAVVKKVVELIGPENLLAMTDSVESKRLAGRDLYLKAGSTLLYQDEGIVAAGSQTMLKQIQNMFSMGLDVDAINKICHFVPTDLLKQQRKFIKKTYYAEADNI